MRVKYRAVFARGGTSKALIFRRADLPADRDRWDEIFLTAMGSPDPYQRQLNGMGGGISSLSKVCVVGIPSRPDADVDYTFAQVSVDKHRVDYAGNCGNMASAIGPFAVDEGLIHAPNGDVTVRIHNVNTGKIIHATFPVMNGMSLEEGELVIPGVSGSGSPVRLEFLDPGGATTGQLLPTGTALDLIKLADRCVEASLVDAGNSYVFVDAAALGLSGTELPTTVASLPGMLDLLAEIRACASLRMGIAGCMESAREQRQVPFIAFIAPPHDYRTLSGDLIPAGALDLSIRAISNGQPHLALPITGALCTAVAAEILGTLPHRLARPNRTGPLRLGTPSGIVTAEAAVRQDNGHWHALKGCFSRTTRRLFEGFVYARAGAENDDGLVRS